MWFLITSVITSQLVGEAVGRFLGGHSEMVTEVAVLALASVIYVWGRYQDG